VIDVIPIAFVNVYFSAGGLPQLDLSNASILIPFYTIFSNFGQICGTGSAFPGTNLANCQFLAAGIQACQAKGKLITISLGKCGPLSFYFYSEPDHQVVRPAQF
jgi:chitinase